MPSRNVSLNGKKDRGIHPVFFVFRGNQKELAAGRVRPGPPIMEKSEGGKFLTADPSRVKTGISP